LLTTLKEAFLGSYPAQIAAVLLLFTIILTLTIRMTKASTQRTSSPTPSIKRFSDDLFSDEASQRLLGPPE